MPKRTLIHVRLSPHLKRQFERVCEARDVTMSGVLRQMVINLIREEKKANPETFAAPAAPTPVPQKS